MPSIAFIHKAGGSIVVFVNGRPYTAEPSGANYTKIVAALEANDYDSLVELFNLRKAIADYSEGQVEIYGNELYFAKQLMKGALAERIIHLFKNGVQLTPYIKFMTKLENNPLESSREELFLFMESNNLPITPDGDFLAYKFVRQNWRDWKTGTLDNSVGNTVSMPREQVDANRNQTCSTGLHVCAFEYANGWSKENGLRLVAVKVNPRDVVSVPIDYNNMKMRVCRYTVVDEIVDWNDSIPKNYTDTYVNYEDSSNDETEVENITTDNAYATKLNAEKVREIRKLLNDEWTLAGISRQFGISARQVARIRDGESWGDVK